MRRVYLKSMRLYILSVIVLFIITLILGDLKAQEIENTLTNRSEANLPSKQAAFSLENFNINASISAVTDAKETTDRSKTYDSEFFIALSYAINDNNSLGVSLAASKELSQYRDQEVQQLALNYTRSNLINHKYFSLSSAMDLKKPTSETSIKREQVIGRASASLNGKLNLYKLLKGLQFTYSPSYTRSFHEYTTTRDGNVNINRSFSQLLRISQSLFKNLTLSSSMVYIISHNYLDRELPHQYITIQQASYSFTKNYSIDLGIRTGGSLINPEKGRSEQLSFYDEDSSLFYTALNVNI